MYVDLSVPQLHSVYPSICVSVSVCVCAGKIMLIANTGAALCKRASGRWV